jgi:hypothetical protein
MSLLKALSIKTFVLMLMCLNRKKRLVISNNTPTIATNPVVTVVIAVNLPAPALQAAARWTSRVIVSSAAGKP